MNSRQAALFNKHSSATFSHFLTWKPLGRPEHYLTRTWSNSEKIFLVSSRDGSPVPLGVRCEGSWILLKEDWRQRLPHQPHRWHVRDSGWEGRLSFRSPSVARKPHFPWAYSGTQRDFRLMNKDMHLERLIKQAADITRVHSPPFSPPPPPSPHRAHMFLCDLHTWRLDLPSSSSMTLQKCRH